MFRLLRIKWMVRCLVMPALAVILLSAPNAASANNNDALCERLNKFIDPFVELAMFDGVIMIDVAGETCFCTYGFANYEYDLRHDVDTQFRIASVSKTLTKAAFGRLIHQGKLSADDLLSQYLPDFPKAEKITIRHLLENRSGIAHTNEQPWGHGRVSLSLDDIVERLAATPFDFEPGESREYSNGGYAVAAKALEAATGMDFGAAMRVLVFEPLQMHDTGHIEDARALAPQMARGYEPGRAPGSRRHTRFYAVETRPGGGSLYSTAPDLMAFLKVLAVEEFLPSQLLSSIVGIAPDDLFVSDGRSPGFVAKIYRDPVRNISIVSLSNNYAVPTDWAEAIADTALGATLDPQWPRLQPSQEKVDRAHPFLGEYASNFGVDIAIKLHNGAVYFHDPENQLRVGMPRLANDMFLLPIYFSLCQQDNETRIIRCEMLSGDERYTQVYTPIEK